MSPRFSLLAKIYLSTAVAVTTLFAAAGWFFERQASIALHESVEHEVRSTLGSIDATWQSRAEVLSAASSLLASMSDVRAAFGTRDQATIRDTAAELWGRALAGRADAEDAAFAVADPNGTVLASVGGKTPSGLSDGQQLPPSLFNAAMAAFPKQSSAFADWDGTVWQVLTTPVYVDSGKRSALLSVLLAAHPVTEQTLRELKNRTGDSDFLLRVGTQTALSTLRKDESEEVVSHPELFAIRPAYLKDREGKTLAELWAVHSFDAVETRVGALQTTMVIAWLIAMTVGLASSYLLARRIVSPIRALNEAAGRVSREDYSLRVPEGSADELGVLARTFNHMSASIVESRAEQIRSGQIAAVGRLAASVAHDLRNPLSAIVGGSEMLASFDLSAEQVKETSRHIHRAAVRMEQLLSEIGQVARSGPGRMIICEAGDLVREAVSSQMPKAEKQSVSIRQSIEEGLQVRCEKQRVERVIINLIANSIEALSNGGEISIDARRADGAVCIEVGDNGPGVPEGIRVRLFEPFVTAGKKNGLGLGLALARQTMLDHDGNLELVSSNPGTRFRLRLPLA